MASSAGRLKQLLKNIVAETLNEMKQQSQDTPPLQGTVASLNTDGTVNITTSDGTLLQNIGAATQFTIGAQVIIISAQGVRTAVPYQ
jgi:hypothetical protein